VRDYGITVFTDTTERAPTFSLVPFGRNGHGTSLCYVVLDGAERAADAWSRLLARSPRALDWPEVDARTTSEYLHGFDFSARAASGAHPEFRVREERDAIRLELGDLGHDVSVGGLAPLKRHVLLKLLLNAHSTLVMGRLGRYEGNLMTWVTPTNGKLVDRAARCTGHLLRRSGVDASYERIVEHLFVEMERAAPGESVVVRTWRALLPSGPSRRRPRGSSSRLAEAP
jgi:N-acetylmuramic acid 6-phosphate etherase